MLTILERLVNASMEDVLEKSVFLDHRVQMFERLARSDGGLTVTEMIAMFGDALSRRRITLYMNELINLQLATYDFRTKTYKYRETEAAMSLNNTLELIKCM